MSADLCPTCGAYWACAHKWLRRVASDLHEGIRHATDRDPPPRTQPYGHPHPTDMGVISYPKEPTP